MLYLISTLLLIALIERWALMRSIATERASWRSERTELLNRVQMPEAAARTSMGPPPELVLVDPLEPDESNLVGRIVLGSENEPDSENSK